MRTKFLDQKELESQFNYTIQIYIFCKERAFNSPRKRKRTNKNNDLAEVCLLVLVSVPSQNNRGGVEIPFASLADLGLRELLAVLGHITEVAHDILEAREG